MIREPAVFRTVLCARSSVKRCREDKYLLSTPCDTQSEISTPSTFTDLDDDCTTQCFNTVR